MIETFIMKKGVTKCPGAFTPELAQHHIRQRELWDSMTPEERYRAGLQKHRGRWGKGRKPNPNQTEKQKKAAEYQKKHQEKKRRERMANSL